MLAQSQLTGLQVSRGDGAQPSAGYVAGPSAHPTSFSTTTGPPSWEQRLWLAVLHAGPTALIGGLTAAKVHGLRNWDGRRHHGRPRRRALLRTDRGRAVLQVLVGRWRTCGHVVDLPLCMVEPAILLFAGYEPNRRTAHGAVAAVVQQRLTDAERLRDLGRTTQAAPAREGVPRPARGHQWRGAVPRRGRRQPCLHRVRGPATQPAAPAPRLPREGPVHRLRVAPRRRAGVGARGGWGFPHGVRPVHERHAPSRAGSPRPIEWWFAARRTRSGTSPTR